MTKGDRDDQMGWAGVGMQASYAFFDPRVNLR